MARTGAAAVISVERFFELSLLGLVASGYLAVVSSGYLDTPTAVLAAAGLCLRALLITGAADHVPAADGIQHSILEAVHNPGGDAQCAEHDRQ